MEKNLDWRSYSCGDSLSGILFEEVRHKQVCSATENSHNPDDSDIENEGNMLRTGQQQCQGRNGPTKNHMWTFLRQTDVEDQNDPN